MEHLINHYANRTVLENYQHKMVEKHFTHTETETTANLSLR